MDATTAELRIIALLEQLVAASQPRPALMDLDEVARDLGIGVRTLQRLKQLGQVPAPIKVGGQVRWRRADVEAWIAQKGGERM